jgi:hypothetical protein
MAKVLREGYFGWEESLKIAGTFSSGSTGIMGWTPSFTWIPGQCLKLDPTDPTYGILCDTAGEQIFGIVMDDDTELAQPPAAELATVLHGHSSIKIDHTAENAAGTVNSSYLAYEKASVEASTPMDLLWTNASGKLSTTASGSANRPAGFVRQVPSVGNNYTLRLILFG